MWTLAGQVDSLSALPCAHHNCSNEAEEEEENCDCTQILASQPGGKFVSLTAVEASSRFDTERSAKEVEGGNVKAKPDGAKEAESREDDSAKTDADPMRERSSHDGNYPLHGIVKMRNISVRI